jgi:8-oxo-dGTP pyrophosphatase MutT (NUDIX family)
MEVNGESHLLRDTIERNLRRFERRKSELAQTPAAVSIVVLLDGEVPVLPIFQRPLNMRRHAGQMALPGGRLHDGEDVEECALRELAEELDVTIERHDVLGRLDDFDTRSGFTITPVVVWSGAAVTVLHPSPSEVARLFIIPAPELQQAVAAASKVPADEFSLKFREVEVFAPTAAMLFQFSEVALDGRTSRVADFHQPPWTHR